MLHRLKDMLAYSAEPVQALLASMPKEDLRVLPWLARYSAEDTVLTVPKVTSPEESAFAASVFGMLGTTDLEGQLSHLEMSAARAAEYRETAREKVAHSAKAYAVSGICAGLSLGLLLL